mmetsp:Transcript_28985/g.43789  ORF Transcript_28985/g.43789 Transcript_28985/m.43789 type:complete len:190 (+) Transcript_28985:150-719(+)
MTNCSWIILFFINIVLCIQHVVVNGFSAVPGDTAASSSKPKPPVTSIQIVGLPGGKLQTLPIQYVKSFPRWIYDDDNNKLHQVPSSDGFVNPTSVEELYWPLDLHQLQIRPTLHLLFSKGSPTYAAGGIEVRVPPEVSNDEQAWYNYGLASQPLAYQWTTFGFTVEPEFRVETFVQYETKKMGTTHRQY